MTETLIATAVGSGAAALVGKLLWERWRAPERVARDAAERFVSQKECERCLGGTQQRMQTLETGLAEMRRENRDDHRQLFEELRRLSSGLNGGRSPG